MASVKPLIISNSQIQRMQAGDILVDGDGNPINKPAPVGAITFNFGNGRDEIQIGTTQSTAGFPYAAIIKGWYIAEVTDESGITSSIEVEFWKDTSANYPPTSADKISGTEPAELTAQKINNNTTISSWTDVNISQGDVIKAKIISNTDAKKIVVTLKLQAAYASGTLTTISSNAGNVGTGEDDLHSYTISGGTLATDNDVIAVEGWGTSTSAGPVLKVYFNGTVIGNFQLSSFSASAWRVTAKIVRITSTQVWTIVSNDAEVNVFNQTQFTNITGLNLTTSKILKFTGEGVATNDIVQKYTQIKYEAV
jgi:hypothetical protein